MGQTLTHGIYLPDEGERNCYNGLASNWQLLDGAVGTVAEHTTQIAGKAPAVHTHTKSDITDLFNSANTWTENNSYTGIVSLNSSSDIAEQFKQKLPKDVSVSADPLVRFNTLIDSADHNVIVETSGHWATYVSKSVTLKYKNDSTKQGTIDLRLYSDGYGLFYPQSPFECSLGNSGNQWKSVYAKNYYYNGTAWGLDQANTWSNINSYQREICLSGDRNAYIAPMWEGASSGIAFLTLDATKTFAFGQRLIDTEHNNRSVIDGTKGRLVIRAGEKNNETYLEVEPKGNNTQLGNSTNKWKTLNGVSPGALSLPTTDSTKWVDLSGNLTAASSANTYTPAVDGWISIMLKRTGDATAVFLIQGNIKASCFSSTALVGESAFAASACIPVRAGISVDIHLKGSGVTIDSAYFMPCQGNI